MFPPIGRLLRSLVAGCLLVPVGATAGLAADQASPWQGSSAVEAQRPFHLGLGATAPWFEAARKLGVRAAAGAAVLRVDADGEAYRAGLRAGDLIVRFGEFDIENVEDLVAAASLVPRGSEQTIIFVRNNRRWQTPFRVVDAGEAAALNWYVHPDGVYRVQIPPAWRLSPPSEAKNVTILYDSLESPERLYQVMFDRRSLPANDAETALAEFLQRETGGQPDAQSARLRLGDVPAVWTARPIKTETLSTYYAIGLVHAAKLYKIDAFAPATADVTVLPLPLRQLLGTLQTAVVAAGRAVDVGDVRLRLPEDWRDGPPLRAGEAMWRVGEFADPDASLALLRNQPLEPLTTRLKTPKVAEATVLGRKAHVYEGEIVGGTRPARMRIVIVPAGSPAEDDLIWVCYARAELWPKYAEGFTSILTGAVTIDGVGEPANIENLLKESLQ